MDDQLQRLIELQTEHNQLLKKYLWRFRFSLLTLLLLTTGICCSLGFVIYKQRQPAPTAIVTPSPASPWTASSGTVLFTSGTLGNPTSITLSPSAAPAGAVPAGPEGGK
jgi:hypothetical protein